MDLNPSPPRVRRNGRVRLAQQLGARKTRPTLVSATDSTIKWTRMLETDSSSGDRLGNRQQSDSGKVQAEETRRAHNAQHRRVACWAAQDDTHGLPVLE